ncbi:hypothetical protein HZH66_014827 [Vespula vulgaris]|uniref:Uncharacterized protein n=1 Tax=Vespula vulgaris TaxID=7454 RepID=A0A834J5L4_VESVU|nr:hypothetical protein HZH66_014827 [Vespula vulgaris]
MYTLCTRATKGEEKKKETEKKKKHFRRKRKRRNEKEKEKEEEEKDGRRKSFTNLKLSSVGCARALERIDFVLCQILSRYFHALSAFELSGQTLTNFSVLHENTKSRYDCGKTKIEDWEVRGLSQKEDREEGDGGEEGEEGRG